VVTLPTFTPLAMIPRGGFDCVRGIDDAAISLKLRFVMALSPRN